jgi:hypothetical protein
MRKIIPDTLPARAQRGATAQRGYIIFIAFALAFCLQGCFIVRQAFAPTPSKNPADCKIIVRDIENFWQAYDKANQAYMRGDTEAVRAAFNDLYWSKASIGLEDFENISISSREQFWKTALGSKRYFDTIRAQSLRIGSLEQEIRAPFIELQKIYPDAVFPDIYFVFGHFSSGGKLSRRGLLIGAEFYSLPDNFDKNNFFKNPWLRLVTHHPSKLKNIIAHELIHAQQPFLQFSGFRDRTLLEASLHEGAADFVCALIAGETINDHVRAFAEPKEKELWKEFEREMNGTDFSKWLYNGVQSTDRPADLGYWIGSRICKAYYDRANNKQEALKTMLTTNDALQFLRESGYAQTVDK